MPDQFPQAECRDAECRAPIIWARTPGKKSMPVDAVPNAAGNVLLTPDAAGNALARVVDPNTPTLGDVLGTLHTSHFATCPGADRWRTRRRTP